MSLIIGLIIAYLLGSLSSAIILAKILKQPDPRTQGSQNPGATNILRTVGKKEALMVLIGDAAKGLLAVLIGRMLGLEGAALGLLGLAAILGHVFPVFFKFEGGKGVATTLGAILGLSIWIGLLCLMVWALVAYLCRYASAASLSAIAIAPLFFFISGEAGLALTTLIMLSVVAWKHRENIERLRNHTENKLEF